MNEESTRFQALRVMWWHVHNRSSLAFPSTRFPIGKRLFGRVLVLGWENKGFSNRIFRYFPTWFDEKLRKIPSSSTVPNRYTIVDLEPPYPPIPLIIDGLPHRTPYHLCLQTLSRYHSIHISWWISIVSACWCLLSKFEIVEYLFLLKPPEVSILALECLCTIYFVQLSRHNSFSVCWVCINCVVYFDAGDILLHWFRNKPDFRSILFAKRKWIDKRPYYANCSIVSFVLSKKHRQGISLSKFWLFVVILVFDALCACDCECVSAEASDDHFVDWLRQRAVETNSPVAVKIHGYCDSNKWTNADIETLSFTVELSTRERLTCEWWMYT